MSIATGVNKKVAYKKETSWGVAAGASGGKYIRRVTSNFNLSKETYQSDEIRTDYQMADYRHGTRSVEGSINGELSPGSYADFFAAALAKDFVAGATTGAVMVIAATTGPNTLTRSAGSFLTDGFKIGEVVRASGFTTVNNNNRNLLITGLTATVMTVLPLDGGNLTAEAEGDTVTVSVVGKKTFAPLTGHTDDSFTFEEFYDDINQSEVTTGNKVNSIAVSLPASGLATVDLAFMGKDLEITGTSQYFTSPTEANTNGIFAAVNGYLLVGGSPVALVTGLNFTINRNLSMEAVLGSDTVPDIFEGRILVDGEFTAFFQDRAFSDLFANEVETSLVVVLTTSNAFDANFVSVVIPRIKVNSDTKNDGEQGIVSSHSFQALLNTAGGTGLATEKTTMLIQDSTVV